MEKSSTSAILVTVFLSLMCARTLATLPSCSTAIQCIKDNNGGTYPINALTAAQVIYYKNYSIVWYTKSLIEENNITCISTKFGLLGSEDTYHRGCSNSSVIDFKTQFNVFKKTFTISEYEGMTLQAYAVAHKKYCLALFVCSEDGVTGHHITLYCPTSKLSEVAEEIEEAKEKFTTCNINNGAALCQETCS